MRYILLIAFLIGLNSCGGGGGGSDASNSAGTGASSSGGTSTSNGTGSTGSTTNNDDNSSGNTTGETKKPIVINPIEKPIIIISKPIVTVSTPIISTASTINSAKVIDAFQFSGENNWTKVDGIWESAKIADDQSSCIEFNITSIVYSRLSFYSKVSSEPSSDIFDFYIDKQKKYTINGEENWKKRIYTLSNGTHTVKWCYTKDDATSSGSDKAWLKEIKLTEILSVSENALANDVIGNISISLNANVSSFDIQGEGKENFAISNTGVITLVKQLDYETKPFYVLKISAINHLGKGNLRDLNISVINEDDLYIKTAILDNNTLDIYFSKAINESTINSLSSNNYLIEGVGTFGSNPQSVYSAFWQRDTVSLGTDFVSFIANESNISIKSKTIADTKSIFADRSKTTIINKNALKKTYQKLSYGVDGSEIDNASVKDDGYYQKGVIGKYIANTAKTTIIDVITGLLWEDNNVSIASDWTSANSYCTRLSLEGKTDWRLPTIKELQNIDKEAFISIGEDRFWSSSVNVANASNYWVFNLSSGETKNTDKTAKLYLKCVH